MPRRWWRMPSRLRWSADFGRHLAQADDTFEFVRIDRLAFAGDLKTAVTRQMDRLLAHRRHVFMPAVRRHAGRLDVFIEGLRHLLRGEGPAVFDHRQNALGDRIFVLVFAHEGVIAEPAASGYASLGL